MYPPANHFTILLLVAEGERRRAERPVPESVRPTTYRALPIGRLISLLSRGRVAAAASSMESETAR